MSFLRVKPGTAGMVLADFDSRFNSPYYQSEYDDGFNITVQVRVGLATGRLVSACMCWRAPAAVPLQAGASR